MINKSDSRCAVVRFCYHSYDYRPNWTPLSPIIIINQLQVRTMYLSILRIQNAAARLVTGAPRFCHVTPLPFHFHWLPISYRIKLKILLLVFKCLYGLAPNYLIDLISIKKQSRYSLGSNDSLLLELPTTSTRPTLGDRAFQSAAPYFWNALPSTIRNIKTLDTFKTAVKTHFFFLI